MSNPDTRRNQPFNWLPLNGGKLNSLLISLHDCAGPMKKALHKSSELYADCSLDAADDCGVVVRQSLMAAARPGPHGAAR